MKAIFLISILILFTISYAAEPIDFTVTGVNKGECSANENKYSFVISGTVEGECTDSESFPIKLVDHDDATKCTLSCSTTSLNCEIDLTKFPLKKANIVISETKPESEQVNLPNWAEFFTDTTQATVASDVTCEKGQLTDITYTANSYDDGAMGCVWTNSTFTLIGELDGDNKEDVWFYLPVSKGEEEVQAYCRIPACTDSTDKKNAKMYCQINNPSRKEIEVKLSNVQDISGKYNIYIYGNNVKFTTEKCSSQGYLMQKILFSILLLGLLI